jgi:hypothetical protein
LTLFMRGGFRRSVVYAPYRSAGIVCRSVMFNRGLFLNARIAVGYVRADGGCIFGGECVSAATK